MLLLKRNKKTLESFTALSSLPKNEIIAKYAQEFQEAPQKMPHPQAVFISFHESTVREAQDFFTLVGRELTELGLNIGENVPLHQLHLALTSVNENLQKLKLTVQGKKSFPDQPLELTTVLPRFQQLQKFSLCDSKELTKDARRVIGLRHRLFPYRIHRGLGIQASRLRDIVIEIDSNVDVACFRNIPASLREIEISHVLNIRDAWSHPEADPTLAERFKNLTRLEIQGPWLCSLSDVLKLIFRESKGIETLILTGCAVCDEDLTGLCREACIGIGKGMTYDLDEYTNPTVNTRGTVAELVENAPAEWDRQRNMRRPVHTIAGRTKLSDLKRKLRLL
jgi:hypothetical protein